jgi:hypothetical protein
MLAAPVHCRVNDSIERRERGGIGQHLSPKPLTIEAAVGSDDVAAKVLGDLLEHRLSWCLEFTDQTIGVDHRGSPRAKQIRDRCLAGPDVSSQSDGEHG